MATELRDLRIDIDEDWQDIARSWSVRPGTTYLNHGSFGLAPDPVKSARQKWIAELDSNPMDFFVRELEGHVDRVLGKMGDFFGTDRKNLVFADNATYAMNVVAESFPLNEGDQVLLNDHEYGAVHRIWNRRCHRVNAEVKNATLPEKFESADQVVDAIFRQVNEKTRLIVVSHITSPTAVILPIAEITRKAKEQGIAVCVDGPHALAQLDVQLDDLGCDFYTASCHKWLCATLGSGFLYAHPRWHDRMEPLNKSWGRLLPAMPEHWTEEFTWAGTRDISAFLSVETAIDFMEGIGLENFRKRTHWLAQYSRTSLEQALGTVAIMPDSADWYGTMAHVPFPDHLKHLDQLQENLWNRHGIEVPIIDFNNRWYVRVSNHLYNTTEQIDKLVSAILGFVA